MPTTTRTNPRKPEETRADNAERLQAARESFSGRLLTDAQFREAIAITGIIEREIHRSGTFKEKLGDYAYAFARTEKFDAMKAESVIRDLYKERTGQSMNQTREALIAREQTFTDADRQKAYDHACAVGDMIEKGNKMSFNRAYAHQADRLARDVGITEVGAKKLMAEEFRAVEQTELYDWGKGIEEQFYRPQIEAEKQQRDAGEVQGRTAQRQSVRQRTGPSGP